MNTYELMSAMGPGAGAVYARFKRDGTWRELVGVASEVEKWKPILLAHRDAIAVHGALHRAGLLCLVEAIHQAGPGAVSVKFYPGIEDHEKEAVEMALVGRGIRVLAQS